MKVKKWHVLFLSLLCFCFLFGGIAAWAEEAEPVYTEITRAENSVTTSSVLAQPDDAEHRVWEISKLTTPGRGSCTLRWGFTENPSADEWIKIDLSENKTIGKIILNNECGNRNARKFVVFGSVNDVSWFELARYEDGEKDWEDKKVELTFDAATVRYVKISLREKGQDGNAYLVAMSQIQIFETDRPALPRNGYTELDVSVEADATLEGGASVDVLTDGISADNTSSSPYWCGGWKSAAATDTDELILDAGKVVSFGGISLFPRCARTAADPACVPYGFPKAFSIYTSEDGENFTSVSGQTYSDYRAELSWNDFYFKKPVQARYVKFRVTERGLAGDNYLTQLAEVKAWRADFEAVTLYEKLTPSAITSSGSWTNDSTHDKASDGNYGTAWVAPWGYSEHKYADEFICYDLGASKLVGQIKYYVDTVNAPECFRVLVSENGEDWGVLARVDGARYENKCLTLAFDSVSARYVRTEIFVKGVNVNNYLGGFTEIEVYEADDDEAMGEVTIYANITEGASVKVSSQTSPNVANRLVDGITANKNAQSNYWMSSIDVNSTVDGSATEVGFDGFYFEFEQATEIDALWLFPRFDGTPGYSIGFPVDFTIVYSENGQEWFGAGEYKNYEVKAGWNEFAFEGTATAKYAGVYVQTRGINGELYTIEFAEARVYAALEERGALQKNMVLDTSKINVTPYVPAEVIYTYDEFRLDLSEHFAYTLEGELSFAANAGKIEVKDGKPFFLFTPTEKGVTEVKITCTPQGKTSPKGELTFSLNAAVKDNPDVIVRAFVPEMNYSVGVTMRVDVADLFLYEGKEKLSYATDKGTIETKDGKTYLVFTATEAGEVTLSVTATPEGKEEKKATNTITLQIKAAPDAPEQQPPVYGPPEENEEGEGGCGASVAYGALALSVFAIGAAAVILKRKKQS